MKQVKTSEEIFIDKIITNKIESYQLASEYAKIIKDKEKSYYHILRKKLNQVNNTAEFRYFIQKFHKEVYENGYDYAGNIINKGMVEELKTGIITNGDIIELWNPKQTVGVEIDLSNSETVQPITSTIKDIETVEFAEPKTRRK